MPWSAENAAHVAVFSCLKRDGQFREAIAFDDAGERNLATLAYWLATASPGLRAAHARNYISGMVLRLIYGHDLTPTKGDKSKDWEAAYKAIEKAMLAATGKDVAGLGVLFDETYRGWDLP